MEQDERISKLAAIDSGQEAKREQGNEVQAAQEQKDPIGVHRRPVGPAVRVDISEDQTEAYVTLAAGYGTSITEAEIRKGLESKGVVYGINEDAIRQLAVNQSTERTIVAKGKLPEPGTDAQVKILFTEEEKSTPKVLEDGSVDFRDVCAICNVEPGDNLVERIPAVEGSPGISVKGKEIHPRKPKDVVLTLGKNVKLEDDGQIIVSTAAGRPVFRGKKISVDPVYVVPGDVNYSTGNIEFVGSVIVRGWVRDGFSVKAEGDIEVQQGVDGAYLTAGGNITVRYGIQGGDKGKITAKGNVRAAYISNALVFAGGDVVVRESIMHSKIYADKRVLTEGGHGLIVGGLVRAGELISAKVIGNNLAQTTIVEVGLNPAIREEILQLEGQAESKAKTLDQTTKAINMLEMVKKQQRRLPPDKEKMLVKLKLTASQLREEMNEAKERKAFIEEHLEKVKNPKIKAMRQIHSGVKVVIRGCHLNIHDNLFSVSLHEKDREIRVGAY